MPLVHIRYKDTVSSAVLSGLGDLLQVAVARHLDCGDEGGDLTPEQIEVFFDPASEYDKMATDLVIEIEAQHYPGRDKGDINKGDPDFTNRVLSLRHDLVSAIPVGNSFGLWVKLNNARWQEGDAEGRPLANFQSGM